jgi:hypothetical protein
VSDPGETSEFLLGGRYTDEEWVAISEVAESLGVASQIGRETPQRNRDAILVALGYTKSWMIESGGALGLFGGGAWFTNCRRCGATLPLRAPEPEQLAPLDQHTVWHAQLEHVLPNGTRVE